MSALTRLVPALLLLGTVTVISAAPDSAAPAAPVSAPKAAPLTAAEMRDRSQVVESQISDDYRHVLALKERAKKQKDVIKVSCVNDKLVQMKAQMNIAETTNGQLQGALDKNADDQANLFGQLTATGDGVRKLLEEANACLGEPELYKQEAGLEVTKPEIPDDPTVVDPYDPGVLVVEPPGYASQFD